MVNVVVLSLEEPQRPYTRRRYTPIHYLCDAYLATLYPSY